MGPEAVMLVSCLLLFHAVLFTGALVRMIAGSGIGIDCRFRSSPG